MPKTANTEGNDVEVMGPFMEDWLSLTVSEADAPDIAAVKRATQSALTEELASTTNADCMVVLAGLGTSLGIESRAPEADKPPTMGDLWADVEKIDEFGTVRGLLTESVVKAKNFEYVLSDAQARLALDPNNAELSAFISAAEKIVWRRCAFVDDDTILDTHELFLRKVGRRSTRLQRTQLFTTNYDLAFETAARRTHFNIIDGFGFGGIDFDGASFDLDYVRRRPHERPMLEPSVFHLLKLHGSVDWDSVDGTVRKLHGVEPTDPVLIYPSAAKYQMSYQQPYLEFMSRFQIALRQPDVGLLVVGCGFNDAHVVAPVEAALRSNIGLRMTVVTPGIRDETRSPSLTWIEDLIKRGDRRLTMVKGTFEDLVRLLPAMPRAEERDVHIDRVYARSELDDQ